MTLLSGDRLGGFSEVEKEKLVWTIKKQIVPLNSVSVLKSKRRQRLERITRISGKHPKVGGQLVYFIVKCSKAVGGKVCKEGGC